MINFALFLNAKTYRIYNYYWGIIGVDLKFCVRGVAFSKICVIIVTKLLSKGLENIALH